MPGRKIAIIKPQPRDVEILRGLFECRVMTLEHAASLFFDGKRDAAKKRLQKLKAAGWITTRPRRQFEAAVYFLTRDGLVILRDKGELRKYPSLAIPALERRARVSDLTIRHELEVMDVKTAFHKAVKPLPDFEIDRFGGVTHPQRVRNCSPKYNNVNGKSSALYQTGSNEDFLPDGDRLHSYLRARIEHT